ncbi:MAG: hypothetical protein KC800_25620, partial [Candidatus Eremiobacteraeota bacterium]|nr:hypothetical protein [Candidatus Eremiobacteraeota bacterium]
MDRLGVIAWVEGDLVSACLGVYGHDERSRRVCDESGECFTFHDEWKKAKPGWGSVSNRRAAEVFLASKLGFRLEAWGAVRLVGSLLRSLKLHLGLLLVVFLPPLFLCWYYFNFFQGRHFESPVDGLTFVTAVDDVRRNEFRKRTVSSVTDPLRQQLEKLRKMRSRTNGGKLRYPGLEQDLLEVRNRLKEIMTEARLRRIPKEVKSNYE